MDESRPIAVCFVSVALAVVAEPSPKVQPESVDIGSRLELFVDGHLIESLKGTRLKLHPPRPAERVLFFDREWEGGNSGYVTVFRDGGRYRMYYRGASSKGYAVPSLSRPGETPVPEHPQVACYAESPDGITWSRPSLGLFEFNGLNGQQHCLDRLRRAQLLPLQGHESRRPSRAALQGRGERHG